LRGLGGTSFILDPYTTITGASGLFAITSGDFNTDGYTDAAITGTTSNTVTIMQATANGAPTPTNFTAGTTPEHITAGNLNGLGLSIAISNRDSASISIMLNSGGTLNPPTIVSLPLTTETPMGIAIGDVDGDGIDDIIVADSANNQVLLLKIDNQGGVGSISGYTVTGGPIELALADIDSDGKLDIVVINQTTQTISILLNTLTL